MNKGKCANMQVRDWLDKSPKLPNNCQKTKPTATVKPVQNNVQPNFSSANKTNSHKPALQNYSKPAVAPQNYSKPAVAPQNYAKPAVAQTTPQQGGSRRVVHVPAYAGIRGNVASGNSVQINVNVQRNQRETPGGQPRRKPAPAGGAPRASLVPRKAPQAPAARGSAAVAGNVAAGNAVQLNVNVQSNNARCAPRPKAQCGQRRDANKSAGTTIVIIQKK